MDVRTLAGLRIESEIRLVGLARPERSSCDAPVVKIRCVDSQVLKHKQESGADQPVIWLTPTGIGSFLIARPDEILVAPSPGAYARDVLGFLLGPCFAAIAYLNGILPLHAGTVDMPEGRIAFVGRAGAGKSTLVGALARRGYAVCSDDVCFVRHTADGQVLAWPGIRWLRLTREAADALAYGLDAPIDDGPVRRKQHILLPELSQPTTPRELAAIYVLDSAAAGMPDHFVRLTGVGAVEQIVSNAYRYSFARHLLRLKEVVQTCTATARRLPVFRYYRVMGFEHLATSLDQLRDHVAGRLASERHGRAAAC